MPRLDETEPGYETAVKRISCSDLALGYACDRVFEAETDDEVLEQALAHARDDHAAEALDREGYRDLVASRD
jgi:predicted small metal-binding protein